MKMIKRMMETKAGSVLKRLFGEETGAVLMEYVILAVMIAAACVVAVIYFGQTASKQTVAATDAMAGKTSDAVSKAGEAKGLAGSSESESETHAKSFSDK